MTNNKRSLLWFANQVVTHTVYFILEMKKRFFSKATHYLFQNLRELHVFSLYLTFENPTSDVCHFVIIFQHYAIGHISVFQAIATD